MMACYLRPLTSKMFHFKLYFHGIFHLRNLQSLSLAYVWTLSPNCLFSGSTSPQVCICPKSTISQAKVLSFPQRLIRVHLTLSDISLLWTPEALTAITRFRTLLFTMCGVLVSFFPLTLFSSPRQAPKCTLYTNILPAASVAITGRDRWSIDLQTFQFM